MGFKKFIKNISIDPLKSFWDKFSGAEANRNQNNQNIAMQKEFAKFGIRWKVADAKAAGLHPLAAMGASTTAYQPVYTDNNKSGVISDLARLGQDVSKSVNKLGSKAERALTVRAATANAEGTEIENDIRRLKLRQLQQEPTPPLPDGSGGINSLKRDPTGSIKILPQEVTTSNKRGTTPGIIPTVTYGRNADGSMTPYPSEDVKDKMEDSPAEYIWTWRNYVMRILGEGNEPHNKPPKKDLPSWAGHWQWNTTKMAYYPAAGPAPRSKSKSGRRHYKHELHRRGTPTTRGYRAR